MLKIACTILGRLGHSYTQVLSELQYDQSLVEEDVALPTPPQGPAADVSGQSSGSPSYRCQWSVFL